MPSFRKLLFSSLFLFALPSFPRSVAAQTVWQPSLGHTQMPLWPGPVPDARPAAGPEHVVSITDPKDLVAGKPWLAIKDVTRPTMTVYLPKGRNAHVAVIVYPGGGYEELAIDLEGTEVCDWLNGQGIACVVLKYRVPLPRSHPYWGAYPESPMALEDAQRAMGIVRSHAKEWNIDPHKVGVLGFSAGGHLVAAVSVHFNKRIYAPVDEADKQSCRPDFAVALYPGHLSFEPGTIDLNPDIANHISSQTPPTFLLQNENDDTDTVWDALNYEAALINAKVPVEFHSYAEGGHGFGLRLTRSPATRWPQLVVVWLHTIGMIAD